MADAIQKLRYTHEALIEQIVLNPTVTQRELAAAFGYTEGWISQVMSSDAFKEKLADKRALVFGPLAATLEERFEATTRRSLDVIDKKLESNDGEVALAALRITTQALGYGARDRAAVQVNNYVVAMPPKSDSATEWAAAHKPASVVDVEEGK